MNTHSFPERGPRGGPFPDEQSPMKSYDAIVVGAGHNGLTTAAFLAKAGLLSGRFYFEAGALFLTGLLMALIQQSDLPDIGISLFGLVSAACFFFPGLKYYRQRNA